MYEENKRGNVQGGLSELSDEVREENDVEERKKWR